MASQRPNDNQAIQRLQVVLKEAENHLKRLDPELLSLMGPQTSRLFSFGRIKLAKKVLINLENQVKENPSIAAHRRRSEEVSYSKGLLPDLFYTYVEITADPLTLGGSAGNNVPQMVYRSEQEVGQTLLDGAVIGPENPMPTETLAIDIIWKEPDKVEPWKVPTGSKRHSGWRDRHFDEYERKWPTSSAAVKLEDFFRKTTEIRADRMVGIGIGTVRSKDDDEVNTKEFLKHMLVRHLVGELARLKDGNLFRNIQIFLHWPKHVRSSSDESMRTRIYSARSESLQLIDDAEIWSKIDRKNTVLYIGDTDIPMFQILAHCIGVQESKEKYPPAILCKPIDMSDRTYEPVQNPNSPYVQDFFQNYVRFDLINRVADDVDQYLGDLAFYVLEEYVRSGHDTTSDR